LALFQVRGTTPDDSGLPVQYWQLIPDQEPTIYHNGTDNIETIAGGQGTFLPGTTFLYSGSDGSTNQFGVVRFTLPPTGDGRYKLLTEGRPVYDGPLQSDADFHVAINGVELFGRYLAGDQRVGYTNILTLAAGDMIELLVGRGQDNSGVASGLKITFAINGLPPSPPPPPPATNFVFNGSFEAGTLGADPVIGMQVDAPDSTTILGWLVESGNIDYVGTRWTAGDGSRCVDLNGTTEGTISQFIPGLTLGHTYRLSFLMAGNPELIPPFPGVKQLRASIGSASQDYSFDASGFSPTNMGWSFETLEFTATGSLLKLSFASLTDGLGGPALDRVSITAAAPPPPPSGLVVNGSFELGTDPGVSTQVDAPDSATITGWLVESGNIDYIGTRWIAGDGSRCLDLSGTTVGTVSQMIGGLTPGGSYRLSFLMAGNPELIPPLPAVKQLRASIGSSSQDYSFDATGFSPDDMGWTLKTLDFTAASSSQKLSFTSLTDGLGGPALDKISITAVSPPPPPPSGLVVNGSFELGTDPGISSEVDAPDSTTITGWSVESGSIDYIGTRWMAGDGSRCLDLSGTSAGTISQQISGLTRGQTYRLSFLMAGNPELIPQLPAVKQLRATVGSISQEYSFDATGFSPANMGWILQTLDFRAAVSSLTLSFTSLTDGLGGPALDAVSIQPAPDHLNHLPVAHDKSVSVKKGAVVNITLEGSDPDGDVLSYTVSSPAHGTLTGIAPNLSYRPATNYLGPDSFNFQVSDGLATSAVATVSIIVFSEQEAPVAKIVVKPLIEFWPNQTNLLVLAANHSNAVVFLDGSVSSGPVGDTLEYLWVEEDQAQPFAAGVTVTNWFELGAHTVALEVSDGQAMGKDVVTFEVITAAGAVDELIAVLSETGLPRKTTRPFIALLKNAGACLERFDLRAGVGQLRAFQDKLRAQLNSSDSVTAAKLTQAAEQIIDGVNSP